MRNIKLKKYFIMIMISIFTLSDSQMVTYATDSVEVHTYEDVKETETATEVVEAVMEENTLIAKYVEDRGVIENKGGELVQASSSDFFYNVTSSGISITGYKGTDVDIVIPSKIDGIPVTYIADEAFIDREIKSIIIPDGVTGMGEGVFWSCDLLETVKLPAKLTSIDSNIFNGCYSLKQINIPSKLATVNFKYDQYLFQTCTSLETVTIEDGMTKIPDNLFRESYVRKVEVPDSLVEIGDYAFYGCKALGEIDLPIGLSRIGDYAFANSIALESIVLPNGVKAVGSHAFDGAISLEIVKLGTGINKIAEYTFNDCTSLKSIEMSARINEIGNYAFYNCSSLKEIRIPYRVNKIGIDAFTSCTLLRKIHIPLMTETINGIPNNSGMVIYGVQNSAAEEYAKKLGITFESEVVEAGSLTINNVGDDLEINRGETKVLDIEVLPSDFNQSFTVTSSDDSIVEINEYGELLAKKCGSASVTINAGSLSKTINVTVIALVTEIKVESTEIYIKKGDSYSLSPKILPENVTIKAVKYSSADKEIATVSSSGKIRAISKGSTVITISACDESGVVTNCTVNVIDIPTVSLRYVTTKDGINTINWKTVEGATGYYVLRKPRGGTWEVIDTLSGTDTCKYKDSTSIVDNRYFYTIQAHYTTPSGEVFTGKYNGTGLGVITSVATVTLNDISTDAGMNTITWTPVEGVQGYVVKRKTNTGKWINLAVLKGDDRETYTDKKALYAGETYTYTVFAMGKKTTDDAGNKVRNYGGFDKTGKSIVTEPKQVTLKSLTTSNCSNILKWNKVNGADGYVISKRAYNAFYWTTLDVVNANTLKYTDNSVYRGASYYYCVTAFYYDSDGNMVFGDDSEEKRVTTK